MSLNPSGICLLGQEHYGKRSPFSRFGPDLGPLPSAGGPSHHLWLRRAAWLPTPPACSAPCLHFCHRSPPLEPEMCTVCIRVWFKDCALWWANLTGPQGIMWASPSQATSKALVPWTLQVLSSFLFSLLCVGLCLSSLLRCNSWHSSKGHVTQITQGMVTAIPCNSVTLYSRALLRGTVMQGAFKWDFCTTRWTCLPQITASP